MRRNSPRTSVTLADVAALAGVSTSTASLAYRSTGSITPATRARILRAAASIGYAGPDPTARSLKSGRSGIVGVVVAGSIRRAFQNPVALATMAGLSEALDELDVGQLLLPGRREPREGSAPLLEGMPVDAVVFLTRGEEVDALLPGLRARRIPMVGVEGPHGEGVAVVDIDDARGMGELARHVRDLGHRRVAVLMRTTRIEEDGPPGPVLPVGRDLEAIVNRTIRERLRAVRSVFPDAVLLDARRAHQHGDAAVAEVAHVAG
ncbi:LacI family transcriptional regulator, partial [Clavibacter lycopersici]|uniref:LacI family DNA-binding transcriptional regulator n=1 Tax=Clavibacter lycopersici TaxID=2301718 RepID=UPI000EE134C7